jgi:hypothetical protein
LPVERHDVWNHQNWSVLQLNDNRSSSSSKIHPSSKATFIMDIHHGSNSFMNYVPYYERKKLVVAYEEMIQQRLNNSWQPYFVSFMFNNIAGKPVTKKHAMEAEVERVYSGMITYVVRDTHSPSWIQYVPIFVGCPDLPVAKWEKDLVRNLVVNDGWHYNGCLLLPPKEKCRLKRPLDHHFRHHQDRYYHDEHPLDRLHVTKIREGTMAGYILKHFMRGNVSADDILILPRVGSEF